ncbi:MAG TPA: hypothetical protein VM536_03635 [Chloroflexia bacterium]|nr:hypothetical protein [Chloroflexia bacterium]
MSARLAAFLALGAAALLVPVPAFAQAKEPPSCAAITFRPLTPDTGDGEHDAGVYKSRFGRVVVKGAVKGGQVENHFVTVNNSRPPAAGNMPASVAACAAEKKLPAPGPTVAACNGDRLQVLVNRAGDRRYVLLYARQGGRWQLCSAGTA